MVTSEKRKLRFKRVKVTTPKRELSSSLKLKGIVEDLTTNLGPLLPLLLTILLLQNRDNITQIMLGETCKGFLWVIHK